MTRNFDQFCSRFLYESLRNSWNPERFMRVIPRDLFNEAKILSMVSKFAKDVNQGKMPGGFIGKLNKKWTVALSEDGELYISGFLLTYKGQKANLTMNYNAGKEHRFPLQIAVENMDLYSVSIYDENGELDYDMRQFEEAPSPGKIDIPDWSSTIEELKRLGKIGLNDDSGLIPKDDTRGFADSFNNGKINNIKVNKNIIENFDQFCLKFLYESVNDDEYLRLASEPEKNDEELQRIIINMKSFTQLFEDIHSVISGAEVADQEPRNKYASEYITPHGYENGRKKWLSDNPQYKDDDVFGDAERQRSLKPAIKANIKKIVSNPTTLNKAWLLVQHMDSDTNFQKWFLGYLPRMSNEWKSLLWRVASNLKIIPPSTETVNLSALCRLDDAGIKRQMGYTWTDMQQAISGLIPKDDTRGFADSFNNGKINNIKVNKNIIENFDQFCSRFLYESVNDNEYLAAVEAGDMETVHRMVNEAAEYLYYKNTTKPDDVRGIPSGIVFHISKQPITKFKNEYKTDLSSMGFHFGTEAQANFRGGQYDFSADNPIMNRVFLKLRNPLRVSHMESYAPEWLADKMIADELLDEDEWVDWNEEQYLPTEVERGTYLVDQLKKWKYDGLVYANDKEGAGDSYVPFDPNQIKSADPITRNNSGNIIPLSSRFDSSKDDIRY